MDPNTLVMKLLLGGILGMAGQGIRVIVGLKKVHDSIDTKKIQFSAEFQTSTLVISLLIGFVAGIVGVISIDTSGNDLVDKNTLLTLLGIGYAGTDFIEAFMKKQQV